MITDPTEYFVKGCGRCKHFDIPACKALVWGAGLAQLRDICLLQGLIETAKWGHPCYTWYGRNIAMIGALKASFHISFFNAALLKDPAKVLVKNGPNSQTASMITFAEADGVGGQDAMIRTYLHEAVSYAKAGIKPAKIVAEMVLPDELITALDTDPELSDAFHALTPGRQKSYVINLNGAKQPATRVNRIAKFRSKIIAGKGALDR